MIALSRSVGCADKIIFIARPMVCANMASARLLSYEYEMAPYTLWDNKRLIRNMWEVTDWSQNLIRIIIRDHEIVYFDAWSW